MGKSVSVTMISSATCRAENAASGSMPDMARVRVRARARQPEGQTQAACPTHQNSGRQNVRGAQGRHW